MKTNHSIPDAIAEAMGPVPDGIQQSWTDARLQKLERLNARSRTSALKASRSSVVIIPFVIITMMKNSILERE